MALLEIRDLHVEYKSMRRVIKAVNGIDLRIEPGQVLGIVGETGAGKSTTALSILGLLPQRTASVTGGEILFDGTDLLRLNEKQMRQIRGREISMIFQDPMTSLNPVITVGEQVKESLLFHHADEMSGKDMDSRVDEIFEMVGIPASRKNEFPHQFSGGMKQRIVIAIALACNPRLLIADEPTTALDVTIQAQVLTMMCELQQKHGMAMIMITHDLGIVAQTCTHVAVIYAGKIVESGTVYDILGEGRHHPYTKGLFNSIPRLDDKRARLVPVDGLMPDPAQLPQGCAFNPRCPVCREVCRHEQPQPVKAGTHQISCFVEGDGHE